MNISENETERLKKILDDPDSVYEDYAFVLIELCEKGIADVKCDVWCEECEEEFEATVNTDTFGWVCPGCKKAF